MTLFLQLSISGLCVGLVYATVAMGLMLLFRAAGVMNFAQGNILAMGAYFGFALADKVGMTNPVLMILVGIVYFIIFGIILGSVCFLPFKRSKWPQAMLICTLGAGIVINQLCQILVTTMVRPLAPIISGTLLIGSVSIHYQYLFIFAIMILMLVGLYFLFERTYCGRVMTATSMNRYAADLIGIPTDLVTIVTFCLVVMMTGFSGWLLAPIYYVSQNLITFQARAFASLVVGGMGALKGPIVGGIIIGLIEAYSTFFTTTYTDVVVFGCLLLMLAVKPSGIFSAAVIKEKA